MASFKETAEFLENNIERLAAQRDRDFARSLINQWNQRGSLSKKQSEWVEILAGRIPDATKQTNVVALRPTAPSQLSLKRIVDLFTRAGNRAAIVFRTEDGLEFRLSVAGERAQQPGTINVTDAERGFENRVWFGRIALDGTWKPSHKLTPIEAKAIAIALAKFDADPAKAAAEYGHLVGSCCFCRRELTDERSVTVGYGPICAEKFGLPWGEVTGPKPENKLTCEPPF